MKSIEEVIQRLDEIILQEESQASALAYFAILYRHMTSRVLQGVRNHQFQDADRMVRLDIEFAQRYFEAYNAFKSNRPLTQSWQLAFSASTRHSPIVLQHLLLGINAHINLDLAIAAALVAPKDSIHQLRSDFDQINVVISELLDEVQSKLQKIWWPLRYLRRIVNDQQEPVINFSIASARKASWGNAVALAELADPLQARETYIRNLDLVVARLAKGILQPGFWIQTTLRLIRMTEPSDKNAIIQILK